MYFIGIINTFPLYIKMPEIEPLKHFALRFIDGLLLQWKWQNLFSLILRGHKPFVEMTELIVART